MDGIVTKFKRISVEEVAAAYESTKFEPASNEWGFEKEGVQYACPLTTITAAKNKNFTFMELLDQMEVTDGHAVGDYPDKYLLGYVHALDGEESDSIKDECYRMGVEDGQEAFKIMEELGAFQKGVI